MQQGVVDADRRGRIVALAAAAGLVG